jgi:hypothetical protein
MKHFSLVSLVAGQLLVVPGCGSDGDDTGDGEDGYEVLLEHEWQLGRGEEFWCVRHTLTEDLVISGFEALAPPGTHHTVLSAGATPLDADGVSACSPWIHNFENLAFESAAGVDRFALPDGIAVRLPAGHQLNLNIHVLNAGDATMSGVTGVKIKRADPATVEQYARSTYVGLTTIALEPQQETTLTGDCVLETDVTAFAVLPHMHGQGTHMKVTAQSSVVGEQVMLDQPFQFATNKVYGLIEPIPLKQDDVVSTACTWFNHTDETIYWGEEYEQEMCFAGVYVYPAEGVNAYCAE